MRALIIGISGQDGTILRNLLRQKQVTVYGTRLPKSLVTENPLTHSPRDQKGASEKKDPLSPPKDKAGKGKVGAIPEAAEEHEDELIPKKKTAVAPNSKGGVK